MTKRESGKNTIIYQTKSGAIELRGDFRHETLWATQAQIVTLFSVDQSVVSRHIKNIFKDGEVNQKSNMQKMHNALSDKPVILYSLDLILAVGYRTNSKRAIEFRQWATKTLHEHITQGFTINRARIKQNYSVFLNVVEDIKKLLPTGSDVSTAAAIELVSLFADTWLSLDAYDKGILKKGKLTAHKINITTQHITASLSELKKTLVAKTQASDMFGTERTAGAIAGIVGNVMQSFAGKELYPTVEEKAAHLLYFIVKNHPFIDGNKRSGAYAFVWFLNQAGILNPARLTPAALTAMTILVAESKSNDKPRVINLILHLITKG